jgi:hypothetical protein
MILCSFLSHFVAAQTVRLREVKDGELTFEPFTIPFEGKDVAAELGRLAVRETAATQPRTHTVGVRQIKEHGGQTRLPSCLS